VDVTRPMNDGASPLFISAQYDNPEVVQLLLNDRRTDPNASMYDGATPMYVACQEGLTDIVKLLLRHPAVDPERSTVDGVAPFFTASQNGHLEIVQALLADPRVNPEKMRDVGASALMVAVGEGQMEVVKLILATGPRISLAPTLNRQATVNSKSVKADWKEFVAAMPQAMISAKDVALVRGQREIHELLVLYERDPKTVVVNLRRELGFASECHLLFLFFFLISNIIVGESWLFFSYHYFFPSLPNFFSWPLLHSPLFSPFSFFPSCQCG